MGWSIMGFIYIKDELMVHHLNIVIPWIIYCKYMFFLISSNVGKTMS
jgi:hypothetical protein